MKFRLKDAREFGWNGIKGFAYNSKEDFEKASATYIEVDGRHGKIKNIIPKNTPYDYEGRMKLFLVDCPAFEEDADV